MTVKKYVRKRRKRYFGSWIQRRQSMGGWPSYFWASPVARQYIMAEAVQRKLLTSWRLKSKTKREGKGPKDPMPSSWTCPSGLTSSTKLCLLKLQLSPRSAVSWGPCQGRDIQDPNRIRDYRIFYSLEVSIGC
jgi:hypothetical protein